MCHGVRVASPIPTPATAIAFEAAKEITDWIVVHRPSLKVATLCAVQRGDAARSWPCPARTVVRL